MSAVILALQPPQLPTRPVRLSCPVCTRRLGVKHRPRVTIAPQHALVMASGTVILENPAILCATCAGRGVQTKL